MRRLEDTDFIPFFVFYNSEYVFRKSVGIDSFERHLGLYPSWQIPPFRQEVNMEIIVGKRYGKELLEVGRFEFDGFFVCIWQERA